MAQGLDAASRGDLEGARRAFTRVVKLAPRVEPGHAALGSVLLALGDASAASSELQIARRLAPEDTSATLNLARARVALADYSGAAALFRETLQKPNPPALSPDESIAFAGALRATGALSEALDVLNRATQASPDSAPLADAVGSTLAADGHPDQALAWFDRATAADPKLPAPHYHRAAALLELGHAEEAIASAQKAVDAAPESFDTQLILGRALSAAHRDDEALPHLRKATQLHPEGHPADAIYELALALQASGDSRAAMPLFASALDRNRQGATFNRSAALTNYALSRVQTGDADGALPLYKEALALGPDTPTLREDLGAAYLQKADLNDALEQFRAGLKLEPDNAQLHYDLGLAYKLKDNLDSAVPEFERAATLDPSLPDPAYSLGVIYMQQGKFPEAASSLRRVTSIQPTNGDAWALLGSVLKDSGDAAGALDALHHAIALQPDQPSLHIQLATLESQEGHRDDAAAERKIAADLSRAANNRQRASFALRSGKALLDQNKLDDAAVQLTAAIQADPTQAEPHSVLAEVYTRQGKIAEAAIERKQAAQLAASPARP